MVSIPKEYILIIRLFSTRHHQRAILKQNSLQHESFLFPKKQMSEDNDDFEADFLYSEDEQDFLEEEQDLNFIPVVADKDIQKPYQVDFCVRSPDELLSFQQKEITQVSAILGCLQETGATLLRYFAWNKERLIEQYMDNPTLVSKNAGVMVHGSLQPQLLNHIPDFCCDICCNDDPEVYSLALSCGHRFCKDCYQTYVTLKVSQEGESRRISCPATGCKMIVDEYTAKTLLDPLVHEK
jgi:ariadne-1